MKAVCILQEIRVFSLLEDLQLREETECIYVSNNEGYFYSVSVYQ